MEAILDVDWLKFSQSRITGTQITLISTGNYVCVLDATDYSVAAPFDTIGEQELRHRREREAKREEKACLW